MQNRSASDEPLPAGLDGARVFVAGHRGLVGSAVLGELEARGAAALVTRTHAELDLTDPAAVRCFLGRERPTHIVVCAARVGGIAANMRYPAEFARTNLAIASTVIHEAWRAGVRDLVYLASSCIYPRECPQPIGEDALLAGPLEPTNRPYAVAKIAGIEMCWAYNRQYGTRYVALMPCNLFGPRDNFDLETSHVLPALLRKVHEASRQPGAVVRAWGTGRPRREFLYSADMARAVVHVAGLEPARLAALLDGDGPPLINVGSGEDITIAELLDLIRDVVGHRGPVEWDPSRPDGTPRKLLDVTRIRALGWSPRVSLREGIERCYEAFLASDWAR
ncbi:MAG: GDP-L-fucose synthase [Ectothiorhodospiraceae bacterium]|nr:GDP-L-fucose synthase [Ectothiorhodospiraceae bacterium]